MISCAALATAHLASGCDPGAAFEADARVPVAGARWGGAAFVLVRDGTPYLFVTAGHVGMTLGTQVLRAPIGDDGTLGEFVGPGRDMPVALARSAVVTHVYDAARDRLYVPAKGANRVLAIDAPAFL